MNNIDTRASCFLETNSRERPTMTEVPMKCSSWTSIGSVRTNVLGVRLSKSVRNGTARFSTKGEETAIKTFIYNSNGVPRPRHVAIVLDGNGRWA
ncbi:MAG: hypothetical protein ACK53Y_16960, partial [bacterium]